MIYYLWFIVCFQFFERKGTTFLVKSEEWRVKNYLSRVIFDVYLQLARTSAQVVQNAVYKICIKNKRTLGTNDDKDNNSL